MAFALFALLARPVWAVEPFSLSNGHLELRFDGATGELTRVVSLPGGAVVLDNPAAAPGCDLHLEGRWLAEASPWRCESQTMEDQPDGRALHVTSVLNGWRLRVTYRLVQGRAAFVRSAKFIPPDGAAGRLTNLRMALPGLRLTDPATTSYALLANYPPSKVPFAQLQPGRTVDEHDSSLSGHAVLLHDSAASRSMATLYLSELEYCHAQVVEGDDCLTVRAYQSAVAEVQAGKPVGFGSQMLCLAAGDWAAGLRATQGLYDLVGLTPPPATQRRAAETVMYSAHPGGTIDSGFRDVGGYREFAEKLPYYHDLGVNMLWILPTWHGYVYAPDDYTRLDPRVGTEAELKALVDQAHALDMRVLLDLIPHGPLDSSKLHEQHPDWICKNQDGSFQYWWGCLYCDYAHPGWQGFMGEHAADWVKRVGVDGYRVDCAGGGPPNWRPYGDNRPSMSGLAGGLGVLAAARQGMEAVKPEVFLLAEAGGPAFFRSADFTYNWAFAFTVAPALLTEGPSAWVPRAAEWLDRQRYSYPRGARQIMFLENHDLARAQLRYGVGLQKALLALCAFGEGTPFLYHDQEIGYGLYLKELYALRAAQEELTLGDTSYTALRCTDPAVLTILRSLRGRHAVVAVNFGGRPTECALDLSPLPGLDVQGRYGLEELTSGGALRSEAGSLSVAALKDVRVALGPYAAAVFLVGADVRPPAAPVAPGPQTFPETRPTATETAEGITVRNGLYELHVSRATGGLVDRLATVGVGGQTLLGPSRCASMDRRLWLGGGVALGAETLNALTTAQQNGTTTVVARGMITRRIGGADEPALAYEVSHVCDAGPEIACTLKLTPQTTVSGVLGSLATTLAFPGATGWSANTLEGLLCDELVPRRRDDLPYHAMYARPHSDRLYASNSLPLDPERGFIGAEWPDGTLLLVRDIRGWSAEVPRAVLLKERLGDQLGLHALLAWADGTAPLTLEKGQTYELQYRLRIERDGRQAVERLAASDAASGPIRLAAEGSRHIVETPVLRAVIGRSRGGSLEELTLKETGRSAIGGTNVYSDYGLYPEWTDPSGNKVRTNAPSHLDIEPEVIIDWSGQNPRLTYSGLLRHPNGFGRQVIEPRTQFRVSYGFGTGPYVTVTCAVRPQVTRRQMKAFLAQTLRLPGAGAWAIYTGDPPGLAAGGQPPGPGDRVWQSATQPVGDADRPRLLVELPGGTCAEFADFGGLQDVQNLFYLQAPGDSVLFPAFLDGQAEDLVPRWRTVTYRVGLHRGALSEVAAALGLPGPAEGAR